MRKIWKKRGVALRMLFSYASLLVLPICIILLMIFPQMRTTMIDNALIGKANNVARLSATLDLHLSEMLFNAVELGQNASLTPYAVLNMADGEYRALQEIKKGKKPGAIVTDYFYYLKASNRFYAYNGGAYPISWLSDTSYGYCYENWSMEEMEADLQSLTRMTVRPLEAVKYPSTNPSAVVTVLIPVPVTSLKPYGVLLCWLDEEELCGLIAPAQADPYECTLIFDEKDQLIFTHTGEALSISAQELAGQLPAEIGDQGMIELEEGAYIYAVSATQSAAWKCVSLTAMEPLLEDINAMRSGVLMIILLLLVSGGGIIFTAIRTQYMPIRSLAHKAEQYANTAGTDNEFEAVHYALEHLKRETDTLQKRMENSLPELRRQKLLDLIGGQFADLESFNACAADVGLHLGLPYLSVAIVQTQSADAQDPDEIADYLDTLSQNIPHGLEGYFLPAINGRDVLFVSAGQMEQSAFVYLTDICADLNATQKCEARAALGTAVTDASRLGLSYSEAGACLERMRLQGQTGVQRGTASVQEALVPTAKLYQIERAIEKGTAQEIEEAVEALIEYLRTCRQSAQIISACYLNALSALIRAMDDLDGAPDAYAQLLSAAPRAIGHEEMALNLKNACAILLEQMRAHTQERQEVDIEQVKAYIREHCLQYDFSLYLAADQFGMSYSGFSHYFKRHTGISCKQFVDDYRTEQAVMRIMHTMKPLEIIAQEVGFSNASAFIRFFKKSTGKTPGSYRNL